MRSAQIVKITLYKILKCTLYAYIIHLYANNNDGKKLRLSEKKNEKKNRKKKYIYICIRTIIINNIIII